MDYSQVNFVIGTYSMKVYDVEWKPSLRAPDLAIGEVRPGNRVTNVEVHSLTAECLRVRIREPHFGTLKIAPWGDRLTLVLEDKAVILDLQRRTIAAEFSISHSLSTVLPIKDRMLLIGELDLILIDEHLQVLKEVSLRDIVVDYDIEAESRVHIRLDNGKTETVELY